MAQAGLADTGDKFIMNKKKLSAGTIDRLKTTTTVFFLPKGDLERRDSFQAAIASVWDLTTIVFDEISNFEKYNNDAGYSYFIVEGVNTHIRMEHTSFDQMHLYLALRLPKEEGNTKDVNTLGLARIELFPDFITLMTGINGSPKTFLTKVYDKGVFYNWSPVLLKAQLAAVQTNLKANNRPWLYDEINDPQLTRRLSKDTLYVPKRVLVHFNKFNGNETLSSNSLFQAYGYKYKICDDKELYRVFETEKRGKLLFEYVKGSTDKFVSIYDMESRRIIYKQYTHNSYNLKSKDLKRIL